ncbi:signal peptide peptidase A. Serine peptidase. MEROPS family S49 [Bryocella elongata]|uniref:Signal peptide peptidase A. Serine peptidase. MEROPS family S49 n=1 Tax=Bryocella elongata TaxID=863522 RepID=A0A1H6C915_9BACT|nr:signal peptide peptidase SppA [Bryocella elongata]SEG69398.1 signal peptide peptidase A. Serine peptidase. MEROPS family S49 [Bryocella elongata]
MSETLPPQPPPPPPYTAQATGPVGYPYAPAYAGYAPPPRRSGWMWACLFALIVGGMLLALVGVAAFAVKNATGGESDSSFGSDSIAVIDVTGVIVDADKIDKELEKYGADDNVKAIILHINSPGGGAAASQEIYHEVLRVRQEHKKKIIASVESVGASGAYYISSACDQIYANPASVVGSIGVIMEWTNYGELMKWAKLKNVTISKGDLKTAGDPSRDLTPAEQAYFQGLVDNMYGQFVHDVAIGRHTTEDKIKPLATGQVWTGEEALPLGLIDRQGGFRVALMDTAQSVGIKGEPNLVRPGKEKHGIFAALSGDSDDLFPNPSKLLDHSPGFFFLWK